jgi:hypothetical protein
MADKNKESWYFEQFRSAWPQFPAGNVRSSESPDFLVVGAEGTLWVELTEFIRPAQNGSPHPREAASIRQQIVDKALALHRQAGGPPLLIDVEFDDQVNLSKRDVDTLASAVARSVASHAFQQDAAPSWYQRVVGPMPRGVSEIAGGRFESVEDWDTSGGGWVVDCTSSHVQEIITKKARRVAAYRRNCDQVALVIVFSAFNDPASSVPENVLAHKYESPFDNTVALFTDVPRVVELEIAPRAI